MTDHKRFFLDPRFGRRAAPFTRRNLFASSGAALLASAIPAGGPAPRFAGARQATPTAADLSEMAEFLVQFIHFEKIVAPFGVSLDDEQLAPYYGLDVAAYRQLKERFAANARQAAEELLAEDAFANRVDRLPFAPGETVLAAGDSITDDLQSWAAILRHLLDLRRPDDQIQVVNDGISGDTTTDVLGRLLQSLAAQPATVICFLGTNDAFRIGGPTAKTRVSLGETALNFAALRQLGADAGVANWAWITCPPCDEATFAANPYAAQFRLSNDDLQAIADLLRTQPEPVVDLVALFGVPPAADLMLADGVHPSLAGQQAIARALVERLTE
jgi:lysophospholipase L1-like esterase